MAPAHWLHRALETYRMPAALVRADSPARLGWVFRDEEELAPSADLGKCIQQALQYAAPAWRTNGQWCRQARETCAGQ